MVVKWPPRLTLASGLFWWVCLNISEYAPKASANMQFPTNFDCWGLHYTQIIISLVSWFLASGLQFKLFIHPIMTLVCSGMLGIDSGCDLLSFWHGGQVGSKANFGLWPLLMSLLEYFRICTQSFRKYAISNQFWPLGAALYSNHYFIGFMVPGLWPLV